MSKKVQVDFALLQCLTFLANRSAITATSDIPDDQARRFISDGLDEAYDGMADKRIKLAEYSDDELISIGFVKLNEDLLLVPIYILPMLPTGTELHSVSDGSIVLTGIDRLALDTRFNCVAYGVKTKGQEANDNAEETIHTH